MINIYNAGLRDEQTKARDSHHPTEAAWTGFLSVCDKLVTGVLRSVIL